MRQVGIDLGTSTIKIVQIEDRNITRQWIEPHYGNSIETLKEGLEELCLTDGTTRLQVTGSDSVLLKGTPAFDEIPAIIEGVKYLVPNAGCIMEIGSQSSRFITDLDAPAPRFSVSGHCAGGTGSFFEDQMSRLGMNIEDYSSEVDKAQSIPRLSGRCAVFAKTDIIHRQQESVTTPDILLGLCYAMIRNYKAVIIKNLPVKKPVVLCGGVACNSGTVRAVKDVFHLSDDELIVPELFRFTAAIGAALSAEQEVDLHEFFTGLSNIKAVEDSFTEPLHLRPGTVLKDPEATEVIPEDGCALGIDIGSTSTDLVLVGRDGTLIDYQYLRTAGDPEKAVRRGLKAIHDKFGDVTFLAVGVTGSGRTRVGRMIGADTIRDEITAQAKGAAYWVPEVDTVFEIGGQDSKYISLKDGEVSDFMMNKVCAAGTGSFIEEQAARMDIPIEKFGPLALTSKAPADLGERCTVFMETAIVSREAMDTPQEDIAAGLCQSVVRNYLHRVVGNKPVGQHIVLQGGVDYNPGIVAAFQQAYGDRVTVSPCFSISGAFGVAELALEAQKPGVPSTFHGFDDTKVQTEAKLPPDVQHNIERYHLQNKLLMGDYDGTIDPNKKTVGVPYVLVIHRMFPLIYNFFKELGYNVLLSDLTNEKTIQLAQANAEGETCYPVKLIYGHMQQLVDEGVDYIFLPRIHTMNHEGADVTRSYGCVYMQSAGPNVARALKVEEKGIKVLSPVFDMEIGPTAMVQSMIGVGTSLGFPKSKVMKALITGAKAFTEYGNQMEEIGRETLASIRPDEKVLVMMTRPYGLNDPVLNMGIPDLLLERGYKVITNENLPGHQVHIGKDFPNMYWPFGQHILGGTEIIARHPNLYAVYLTNHGCGPDSMMNHLVGEVMGDKPMLQIEVDEHFSPIGVITRIEAFLNSLEHHKVEKNSDADLSWLIQPGKKSKPMPLMVMKKMAGKLPPVKLVRQKKAAKHKAEQQAEAAARQAQQAKDTRPILLPDLGIYSSYLAQYLKQTTSASSVTVGHFTNDIILRGRAETRAKEYFPFAALAGLAVQADREAKEDTKVLIPADCGSEAEGVYGLTIRTVLRRNNAKHVSVESPLLDLIPVKANDPDLLFRALMTGDILYAAPAEKRQELAPNTIPAWDELEALAKKVRSMPDHNRRILAVGTPMCMTSLNEGVLDTLESEGNTVTRTPLSEALLFLWEDTPENRQNTAFFKECAQHIVRIGHALNGRNPFALDHNALRSAADQALPAFNGANGRYRWAKTVLAVPHAAAVLEVSPRYENTTMVLDMRGISDVSPLPLYEVELDGDWDETAWSRLRSFLHYCQGDSQNSKAG